MGRSFMLSHSTERIQPPLLNNPEAFTSYSLHLSESSNTTIQDMPRNNSPRKRPRFSLQNPGQQHLCCHSRSSREPREQVDPTSRELQGTCRMSSCSPDTGQTPSTKRTPPRANTAAQCPSEVFIRYINKLNQKKNISNRNRPTDDRHIRILKCGL